MAPKRIWLDCDPGHDDMLAIIMAALSEEVQLLGISTSSGNSCIENTTQNALNILHEIGKADIEVVKGAAHPLCCKLETAPQIHGQSGLEGAQLQKSPKSAIESKPFLHIYQRIIAQQQKIDFVVTGAMTNLAILLKAFPDIHDKIKAITVMGGAIGLGNWSPAAQFNILVDPQAANIVVASKIPITFIPLQVTHKVEVTQEIFANIDKLQSNFCKKLTPLFRYFQKSYKQNQNFQFPVAHDPCTIYYLLRPQDFVQRKAFVEIQLQGNSRGRTNFHFMHKGYNSTVCQKVNVPHFWKLMLECLKKIK